MIQMINNTLEWEKRLEFEEEKRTLRRADTDSNFLAPLQPYHEERKPFLAAVFSIIKQVNHVPLLNSSARTVRTCEEKQLSLSSPKN